MKVKAIILDENSNAISASEWLEANPGDKITVEVPEVKS